MKTIRWFALRVMLLGGVTFAAAAATNVVVLGMNFQSVIDASAPGDTLFVQPGAYPDATINFNKPLTVLPSNTNGTPLQFLGTIQVQGAGATSFQNAYFGGSVQATGSTLSFFDSYFIGPVNVSGGKLTMKRTFLGTNSPLTLSNNAALEALRMTNNAPVNAFASAGSGTPFLAVQSSFFYPVSLGGYKAWFGYNSFSGATLQHTNCDSVVIGNLFTGTSKPNDTSVLYAGGGTLKVYNNLFTGAYTPPLGRYGPVYAIGIRSAGAEIINNTIHVSFLCAPASCPNYPSGIYATNAIGPLNVRGNIIKIIDDGGNAPSSCIQADATAGQALLVSYCDFQNVPRGVDYNVVGVIPPLVNCLLQVNPNLAVDGSLNPGSPCLNAGPPEAIYNNRDGTRNTMGHTGGPYWNPANYTNNNPMVFLLTGQQTVAKGVQTTIPVSTAAAAGH